MNTTETRMTGYRAGYVIRLRESQDTLQRDWVILDTGIRPFGPGLLVQPVNLTAAHWTDTKWVRWSDVLEVIWPEEVEDVTYGVDWIDKLEIKRGGVA